MESATEHSGVEAPEPANSSIFLNMPYPPCSSPFAINFIFNSKIMKCHQKAIGYKIVELIHVKLLHWTDFVNS